MIRVSVHLKSQSQPIEYPQAVNTYQKMGLFCVYLESEKVHKFPLQNIWRIVEDYGDHGRSEPEGG